MTPKSTSSKNNPLKQLAECGQSFWMDTISRQMIQDGTLRRMIKEDGLRGVTSNPDIFQKAISGSALYDDQIKKLALAGKSAVEIYEALAVEDIRKAADVLKPVYDATDGVDGYISLEVSPYLANNTEGTIEEGRRLWASVNKPNVLIKVPATPAGIPAIKTLISEGISVNVTLIFSLSAYADVMDAYIAGIAARVKKGQPVDRVASVASFFISRIDVLMDKLLSTRRTAVRQYAGQVAVASAKIAYADFKKKFQGKKWDALAAAGARVQRPLWASTSTKNPLFEDIAYVTPLIGRDTVNTMPMATIDAWRDHGVVECDAVEKGVKEARQTLADLKVAGLDVEWAAWQIMEEGVAKFNQPFDKLLGSIAEKRAKLVGTGDTQTEKLGASEKILKPIFEAAADLQVGVRLADKDATLFSSDPAVQRKVADRLGWLTLPRDMQQHVRELQQFAAEAKREKIEHVALLGMGGSSLCPEVCARVFGSAPGHPELMVLDSTSPAAVAAATASLNIKKTIFIVASKSGGTLETMSLFRHFFAAVKEVNTGNPGQRFVAITDPGTSLEALGKELRFRKVFINPPDIGGRYSALSLFGLVPMALIGMNVKLLLDRAESYARDLGGLMSVQAMDAVRLGVILGGLARNGRDKLTLVLSDRLEAFGAWVEQLIAESTGKEGRGILPVDGEALGSPKQYHADRVFVSIGLRSEGSQAPDEKLDALGAAGHPVLRIYVGDANDLGIEFLRWEIATAVAGVILGINPFDEPNVSEAKQNTQKLIDQFEKDGALPDPKVDFAEGGTKVSVTATARDMVGKVRSVKDAVAAIGRAAAPGDYIAVLAFLPPTDQNLSRLEKLRSGLRKLTACPVTVGVGPRYLHSTGQLHKGGAANGWFIVIVDEPARDVEIPAEEYSFGTLVRAQGLGDFNTLSAHERRAVLVDLGGGGNLAKLA